MNNEVYIVIKPLQLILVGKFVEINPELITVVVSDSITNRIFWFHRNSGLLKSTTSGRIERDWFNTGAVKLHEDSFVAINDFYERKEKKYFK